MVVTRHDNSPIDDEVPREPRLRELYDDLPHSEPPMHLDARILSAAREATAPPATRVHARPFSRHWAWPVSLVALMVLSVSVVVLVQPQVGMHDAIMLPEEVGSMDPLQSAPMPAMRSLPASKPTASRDASGKRVPDSDGAETNAATPASPRMQASEPEAAPERATTAAPRSLTPQTALPRFESRRPAAPEPDAPAVSPTPAADASRERSQAATTGVLDPALRNREIPATNAAGRREQLEQTRRRGAQQALERDAVRERLRASRNESRKREAATQRRAELKLLLDEAERADSKRNAVPDRQPSGRPVPTAPAPARAGSSQTAPGQTPGRTTAPRGALSEPASPARTSPAPDVPRGESAARPAMRPSGDTGTPPRAPRAAPPPAPASRALRIPTPKSPTTNGQPAHEDASGADPTGRTSAPGTQRPMADTVTREFARIRALLDNGETALAREVYESLLRRYPDLSVPADIRTRLE